MARALESIDLQSLSEALKGAREAKGWTLQQLAHELWAQGFPTSQNKLWRMENKPPKRVDTELLLWLEKVLDTSLLTDDEPQPVLVEDVVKLVDRFIEWRGTGAEVPEKPASKPLQIIYGKLSELARTAAP